MNFVSKGFDGKVGKTVKRGTTLIHSKSGLQPNLWKMRQYFVQDQHVSPEHADVFVERYSELLQSAPRKLREQDNIQYFTKRGFSKTDAENATKWISRLVSHLGS